MIWHYRCPACGQQLEVDWDWHRDEVHCPACRHDHYPPMPSEDHLAYFGGEKWPQELTDAVTGLRGTTCFVPGCYHTFDTLAHRRPVSKGGRTSVDNLVPMCLRHARFKGEEEYDAWVENLSEKEVAPSVAPITITITPKEHTAPPEPVSRDIGWTQPLAALGRADPLSAAFEPLVVKPFLPGPARQLLLQYDWRLTADGDSRVILMAWPHDAPPRPVAPGGVPDCPQAANEHSGKAGQAGSAFLELMLAGPGDRRWTAALATESRTGRVVLDEYLLSLTD